MRNGVLGLFLAAAALVATAGCQRLNFNKTVSLGARDLTSFEFDPPAYEQRLRVSITPTGGGVQAYLVKKSDKDAVERILNGDDRDPPPSYILGQGGSKTAADAYSFDATVPAKTGYVLFVKGGTKPTDAKVNVVGR